MKKPKPPTLRYRVWSHLRAARKPLTMEQICADFDMPCKKGCQMYGVLRDLIQAKRAKVERDRKDGRIALYSFDPNGPPLCPNARGTMFASLAALAKFHKPAHLSNAGKMSGAARRAQRVQRPSQDDAWFQLQRGLNAAL